MGGTPTTPSVLWTRCWAIVTIDGNCLDDYAIKSIEPDRLSNTPSTKISNIINMLIKLVMDTS